MLNFKTNNLRQTLFLLKEIIRTHLSLGKTIRQIETKVVLQVFQYSLH